MTKLKRRLERHRRRQRLWKCFLQKTRTLLLQVFSLFVVFTMLLSMLKLPVAYAYFTAGPKTSAPITIEIEGSVKKTEGQAHMLNPFLLEEASQAGLFSLQGTDMQKTKVLPFSALGEELQSALAGDKLSGFQETAAREKELRVKITLDEGFQASDIYLPSVTLQHAHYTAVTCGGELEGDSLIAIFNLDEIASWFTGQESETDTINFTITGRGWVEDIRPFYFTAETSLPLFGSYQTQSISITGSDFLLIPPAEEDIYQETFTLVNQDGAQLDGARWSLLERAEGIEIDPQEGTLTLTSAAAAGEITVSAAVDTGERVLVAQKTIRLAAAPQAAIVGASSLTIPLPHECLTEQYELVLAEPFAYENLTWSLEGSDQGGAVSLTEEGELIVSGQAGEADLTITASFSVENIEMTVAQKIILEVVPVHAIIISSLEEGGDSFTIPDNEPLVIRYTATVLDPTGLEIAGEPVLWSLQPDSAGGITLSEQGELTISPAANAGEITIKATSVRNPAVEGTKTITLEAAPQAPLTAGAGGELGYSSPGELQPSLIIEGPDLLFLPRGGETKTVSFRAVDQKGQALAGVLWQLQDAYQGVSLNEETGELCLDDSAQKGTIAITAALEIPAEEEGAEPALLEATKEVELTEPAPTSLALELPASLSIPSACPDGGQEINSYRLAAIVLDQKGQPMEGEALSWSLAEDAAGVSLSADGLLTITSEAAPGTIEIVITSASNPDLAEIISVELLPPPEAETPPAGEGGEDGIIEDPVARKEEEEEALPGKEEGDDDGDDAAKGGGAGEEEPEVEPEEEMEDDQPEEDDSNPGENLAEINEYGDQPDGPAYPDGTVDPGEKDEDDNGEETEEDKPVAKKDEGENNG